MKPAKYLLASAVFIAALAVVNVSSSSAQQGDAQKVQARLAVFLDRLVQLSKASPPPAPNAANGYFINAVHGTDVELGNLVAAPIGTSSPEGNDLAKYYTDFTTRVRDSFSAGVYNSSGFFNIDLAMQVLWASRDQIVKSVESIGSLRPSEIKAEIDKIADSLKGKIVTNGAHGNGWVSVNLRNSCNDFNSKLPQPSTASSQEGQKVLLTMRVVCQAWAALPTEGHSPWLTGGWQAGFQAIASEGSVLIRK